MMAMLHPQPVSQLNRIRILHIVGGMVQGGIETWLMHCLRHIDRERFAMDFLVHTSEACTYDPEILALGSRVIPCLSPHQPWQYRHNFLQSLQTFGPYDIVHSHLHHFSGYTLWLAQQAQVPIRIAHSHNDLSTAPLFKLHRHLYLGAMKQWIRQSATQGLACSQRAASALYGPNWPQDSRWQVLYYGLDLDAFHLPMDGVALRTTLGVPQDALVIGHVGRFVEQKNHRFLLEIMAKVIQKKPNAYLVLIGDGPLKPAMEQYGVQLGLQNHIRYLGLRNDVPQLMRGLMDHFLFPSRFEGLGLVLIEAQAAGLPCLFSSVVPQEVDVVPRLLQRLSLTDSPGLWAERLLSQQMASPDREEALAQVKNSVFNINLAVKKLENIYIEAMSHPTQPLPQTS